MNDGRKGYSEESGSYIAGFFILALILLVAPLYQGGNKPLGLLFLELAALPLVACIFRRPAFREHVSRPMLATLVLVFLLPLWQLIPLHSATGPSLTGHDEYGRALGLLHGSDSTPTRSATSLVPFETESAWLALLPPLSVFLFAVGLSVRQLQTLVLVFLGVALFQAVLGLVQFGDGAGSVFYFGNPYMNGSAAGTYVNRNHLAGLLEMALPVALALLVAAVGPYLRGARRHARSGSRRRLARLVFSKGNQIVFFSAVAIAILLGLVFTRSRAGVLLAMLGIFLCSLAFCRRFEGGKVYGSLGMFLVIGIGLAVAIGLAPVLGRFALQDSLSEGRWLIYASSLQAIQEFLPLGSGIGTFEEVFPRFHSMAFGVERTINHAHNDYLEWILEGGIVVAFILILFLGFYVRQWFRIWCCDAWSSFRLVQVGAGIALALMMLHGLVDFNLHIPANAIFFAFLAAVFFHREAVAEKSTPPVTTRSMKPSREVPLPPLVIPGENALNPFDEAVTTGANAAADVARD